MCCLTVALANGCIDGPGAQVGCSHQAVDAAVLEPNHSAAARQRHQCMHITVWQALDWPHILPASATPALAFQAAGPAGAAVDPVCKDGRLAGGSPHDVMVVHQRNGERFLGGKVEIVGQGAEGAVPAPQLGLGAVAVALGGEQRKAGGDC